MTVRMARAARKLALEGVGGAGKHALAAPDGIVRAAIAELNSARLAQGGGVHNQDGILQSLRDEEFSAIGTERELPRVPAGGDAAEDVIRGQG